MTATFDAYHTWLGISPAEQPPHHYRLLGVPIFETDLSVIGNAADRQSVYVKTFLSGKHAATAERILAEIGTARMCLFDAQRRAEYDGKLRARLSAVSKSTSAPPVAGDTAASQSYARPAPRAFSESSAVALQEPEPVVPPPRQKKRASTAPAPTSVAPARKSKSAVPMLAIGGVGLLVLVVGVVFAL